MRFREATIDEASLLLDWRNDPVTRAMSVNTQIVPWDIHLAWLEKRLAQPMPGLYICENDGGAPFGMVRIDGDEISYAIGANFRGQGLATQMLKLARQRFGAKRAKVKRGNVASAKAAAGAGHMVEYIEE